MAAFAQLLGPALLALAFFGAVLALFLWLYRHEVAYLLRCDDESAAHAGSVRGPAESPSPREGKGDKCGMGGNTVRARGDAS